MEQEVPGAIASPAPAVAQAQPQAEPAQVEQPAEATNAETQEEGQAPKKEQPVPPWMRRQVSKARERAIAAETRAAMLEERLSRLEQQQQPGDAGGFAETPEPQKGWASGAEDSYQRARADAAFDLRCDAVYADGEKEFDDFGEAIKTIGSFGPSRQALEAVLEAESPAKVLHYLGTHPEEAEQILGLSPVAMARRIGALEARLAAKPNPPKASSAPEPIKPINARTAGSTGLGDDVDSKTWMERRNAQLAASRPGTRK